MLTLAAESLCLLFFPLFWQHILIPVLPERLLSYLQAPMPYIVGVGRGYFANVEEEGVDDVSARASTFLISQDGLLILLRVF